MGLSETALREAKASLDSASPSAGPMLRSGSPGLVRQELAAWAAGNEMTRGVARAAALGAAPARKGRRAGQRVQAREISHGRTRRAIIAAIRAGTTSCTTLARNSRNTAPSSTGTGTAPARPSAPAPSPAQDARTPLPGSPPPSSPSRTRPPDQRKHRQPPQDAARLPVEPAVTRTTRRPPACPRPGTTHRNQNSEPRTNTQMPKPHGIALWVPSPRKELLRRLLIRECELCETGATVAVHQVPSLKELGKPGTGQPAWAALMAKMRRKTLIVCAACHDLIHTEPVAHAA